MARIDLNADLGGGFGIWQLGDDDAMLGIVSSANVAAAVREQPKAAGTEIKGFC